MKTHMKKSIAALMLTVMTTSAYAVTMTLELQNQSAHQCVYKLVNMGLFLNEIITGPINSQQVIRRELSSTFAMNLYAQGIIKCGEHDYLNFNIINNGRDLNHKEHLVSEHFNFDDQSASENNQARLTYTISDKG